MSLDVYLMSKTPITHRGTGVFIRENGNTRELTIGEVAERYPDSEVTEGLFETNEYYSANITHNLNSMAGAAGIYEHLWRPDEIGITKAKQLIEPLRAGLHELKLNPEKYKVFNPSNGWGSYDGLVDFVSKYLEACYEYPDADIEISR